MQTEIWRGDVARARLHSAEFRAEWERLHADCPWASVFQSHAHASTWYDVYDGQFEPLLVGAVDGRGTLCGLFPLAVTAAGDPIAVGGRQAEYQVWMSRPGDGNAFVEAALDRLSVECPGRSLMLRYLTPNTPLDWVTHRGGPGRRCVISPVRRGIMDLDATEIDATLRRKANRRQLRGLERVGPLTYEPVTDPSAIDALLEEISPLCDLRHGAIHDILPFRGDPLKLAYHRALARLPGLLHVSVLRCGGEVASAQVDVINRGQITLALGAFAPSLARHSPGRLHLLLMAQAAAANGYRSIDLTPGGGYKDQLATRFDHAYTLHVLPGAQQFAVQRAADGMRRVAKSALSRAGVDPNAVRDRAASLRAAVQSTGGRNIASRMLRMVKDRLWTEREVELYELDEAALGGPSNERLACLDELADLLAYRRGISGVEPRSLFLKRALARLERGSHVYTHVLDGTLVSSVWLSTSVDATRDRDITPVAPAPGTAIVHDFAAAARTNAREVWKELLPQVVRDAGRIRGVTRVLIAVPTHLADVREATRQLGAIRVGSAHTRTRGRRSRQWSTMARTVSAPSTAARPPAGVIG